MEPETADSRRPPRDAPDLDDYDLDVLVLWRIALAADGIYTQSWPGERVGKDGKQEACDMTRRGASLAALSAMVGTAVPAEERAHVLDCLVAMVGGHLRWGKP